MALDLLADPEFHGFALLALLICAMYCLSLLDRIKDEVVTMREIEERREAERIKPRLDDLDREAAAHDERMLRNRP